MARLIWTPESRCWLREIHRYISRDSPSAAYKVVHGICEKAHLPLTFPDLGHLHQPEKYADVRILLYGRYGSSTSGGLMGTSTSSACSMEHSI